MIPLPNFLARLAFPWVVAKTAVAREWEMTSQEREMLAAMRAAGVALEWEIRIVARALAKIRRWSDFDAIAAVRAGLVVALMEGSQRGVPSRADLMRFAWRGQRLLSQRLAVGGARA
jgi:hypothetical protein